MKSFALSVLIVLAVVGCDKPAPEATPEAPAAPAEQAAAEPAAPAEKAAEPAEPVIEPKGQPAAEIAAGETKYYGDRFTVIEPPITLAKAMETAAEHEGPYKVEATIAKVCKKKGCWFTLKDDSVDQEVRVKMKDYGFFVPTNADGTKAVVEGTLASREIPQAEAQHYADDEAKAGEEPRKVEGPQKVWEFTATAIELTKSES